MASVVRGGVIWTTTGASGRTTTNGPQVIDVCGSEIHSSCVIVRRGSRSIAVGPCGGRGAAAAAAAAGGGGGGGGGSCSSLGITHHHRMKMTSTAMAALDQPLCLRERCRSSSSAGRHLKKLESALGSGSSELVGLCLPSGPGSSSSSSSSSSTSSSAFPASPAFSVFSSSSSPFSSSSCSFSSSAFPAFSSSSSSSCSSSPYSSSSPYFSRRSPGVFGQNRRGHASTAGSVDAPLADWSRKPRRIALFVEPSPFAYVCGYKNRFCNLIRYLREMGDEVMIVTTKPGAPKEFHGARVVGSASFPCPWYRILPLSLAASPRIYDEVKRFKPDIIHASSPGVMVFGALIFAKLLSLPLVLSYHTHVPKYIPKYTFTWLVKPMWAVIRFCHQLADLTLVTSAAVGEEMEAAGAAAVEKIMVWRMGVDSDGFNPRWKNWETRKMLSNGEPEKPLIVHVGRLGVEKNLDFLRILIDRLPGVRLAFVGDGPHKEELMKQFEGTPTVFTGMLTGEDLSQAYASGDLFFTPSETETLGFVVLEAMASGVPVVAARAGGIPDIVSKEGTTGFLYTPGDVEDALQKINALIESKELREKIGEAGRKEVEKHDWKSATVHLRNEQYKVAVRYWLQKRREKAAYYASLSWLPFWWKHEEAQPGILSP